MGIALALVIAFAIVWQFGKAINSEIDALSVANADGLQWSLSQLEVEYHQMLYAATLAKSGNPEALTALTRRFDIFYSRLHTILEGRGFQDLIHDPDTALNIDHLLRFIDQTVPLIDAGPQALAEAIEPVERSILTLADDVRSISLDGVREFTGRTKAEREKIHHSLVNLNTLVTAVLVALSVALFGIVLRWGRQFTRSRSTAMPTAAAAAAPPQRTVNLEPRPVAPSLPTAKINALLADIEALQATRLTKKQSNLLIHLHSIGATLADRGPATGGAVSPHANASNTATQFLIDGEAMIEALRSTLNGADRHHHAAVAHRFAAIASGLTEAEQNGDDPIDAQPLYAALTRQERRAPHADHDDLAEGMTEIETLWAQTYARIANLPHT